MEKKKLNGKTILVASALFIAVFAQVGFIGSVLGPEGQQHNIWGYTSKAGNSPPGLDITTNRTITAWIDGVSYGYNWTQVTGEYDLYVDGDAWGVAEDNALKDGGWDGDLIYYFLDYDPSSYYLFISDHTSTFNPISYEYKDPIYFDTQTENDNSADTYLRAVKINEVVVAPADTYPPYVILYDFGAELDETAIENNYYLEKCDDVAHAPNGPIFDFAANPTYVEPYGTNYYYINLTGFPLNSQDELKLVWKNPVNWGGPATVDNICNGTDVIVDRVEWGNYENYINPVNPPDDREYDNTSMGDFLNAPPAGQSMIRSTNGTDTDDCSADFILQSPRSPRPAKVWTTDYIEIVDSPGTGTTTIPTTKTVGVGETIIGYAAAFNNTLGGYYADISVTWMVAPSGSENATTNPSPGTSSSFWSGWVGGTVDWIANDGLGHTYTVTVTILPPTPDMIYIVNTGGTGLTEIPDQEITVTTFTMDGYAAGYNNSIGYYGDVSVSWTVVHGGGAGSTNPASGTTSTFDSQGSTVGTDTWTADYGGGVIDTVVFTYNVTTPGGVPGSPTDLRVHKGGGAWGGVVGDIVLEWYAPLSDYVNLTFNIVYYDTDLTDGFQYTNWILFEPNSTIAGDPDWCILPGWDADSNNYAFIVRTTGTDQGVDENLIGTNIGYKYIMTLQKNPTTTSQLVVSIPFYCDWTKASDVTGPGTEFTDGSIIAIISKWNYTRQTYDSRSWNPLLLMWEDDFNIFQGDALVVSITTVGAYDWSIVGAYDDTFEFGFQKNPTTTSQIFTSLPYHKSYIMASDVTGPGTEFTDASIVAIVSQWNYARQTYDSRSWNPLLLMWEDDFTINASPGDHLVFSITTVSLYNWQPWVIAL